MYHVTEFWCSINKTPFMAKICLRAPVCPVVVAGVTEVGTDPRYTSFNLSISCGESVQPLQSV